jgi:hypothetical protein
VCDGDDSAPALLQTLREGECEEEGEEDDADMDDAAERDCSMAAPANKLLR